MENENSEPGTLTKKYIPTTDFYSQVIDSLQDYAIITLDKNLNISSWSAGSAKIFGYTQDEVLGKFIGLIFSEEDIKNNIPKAESNTALNEGRAVDNRWHVRNDGSSFFAYGLAFPLNSSEGEFLGFVKVMRDLTERKQSEEAIKKYVKELEELNNHKENILAILSHDLRSPLGVVIMTAELLKMNYDNMSDDEILKMVELIHKVSTNELKMFDYLLEWARIKYASEVFSPKILNLKNCFEKVLDTLHEVATLSSIKIQNKITETTHVFADEKMLLSIIQNIVSNAIKYSREEGSITITAVNKDEMVITKVEDNGVGIPKEIMEKLFTPQMSFLSNARKENKGAGIGLLLVKGFLVKNGGDIWVESIEGEGSSFYFSLPANKLPDKIDNSEKIKFDEIA